MSEQGEQEQPQENNENAQNEENKNPQEENQIANDQEGTNEQEGDIQPQEEAQLEIPQKVYAPPNPTIKECIANEGLIIDPTYTGKAFWGMTSILKRGNYKNKRILKNDICVVLFFLLSIQ